jgi:4-hydroxy-tetrahydrodipicolinate synthase
MKRELSGIIVPLVTPFDDREDVDHARLADVATQMIESGADFLMGTALTGEGPLLTPDETVAVWNTIAARCAGHVGFVPAIITFRTTVAIELARAAHALGAEALMVAPIVPELYAGRSHDDVYRFYRDVAEAVPTPIVLFNYPSLTGVDLTPPFVAKLADIDSVRYVKESTSDSKRVHAIQRLCGDRIRVICGNPNAALESLALGCDAWITGIMNVVPRASKRMFSAIRHDGDLASARDIYYRHLLPLVDLMMRNSNPTGTIKAGMRVRGLDVGVPRRPGSDVSAEDNTVLRDILRTSPATNASDTIGAS